MKLFRFWNITLGVLAFVLAGCASYKPSTSAKIPPSTTVGEPEIPYSAGPAAQTIPPGTVDSTASPSVSAPIDTGSPIAIRDIPTKKGYPYAIKTKWPGLVKSPYAQDKTLVDVSTLSPGSFARCQHTGKIFVVPQ